MNRVNQARTPSKVVLALSVVAAVAACSGGGSSTTGSLGTAGAFLVLQTDPSANGRLYLNDPIQIDFNHPVNLDSANLNTVSFQVFDQLGNVLSEQVAGDFALARSPGDATTGRRLQFVPRFPTNNTFDNGGFRPGRSYLVQLVGGERLNGTALRDTGGKALAQPISVQFSTAEGTAPSQLFRNSAAGGPARVSLDLSPTPDTTGVVLNKLGQPDVEVRLNFDQPLNPSATNVPVALDTNPLVRNVNARGRVFLEYDDPILGANTWIPADVELESNRLDGATLVLRPVGVLPNNATVRVIVESSLEDISGESNVSNAAYNRVFGSFQTRRAYEEQFDSVIESFLDSSSLDLSAAFGEPVADVGAGFIKAGFAFEGSATNLEFEPSAQTVLLNTNFTQVTPKAGVPYNVSGGVFNFKSVKIPQGVTVQGQGTNPMVWLVSGNFEVAGTLSVRGGDGTRANTIASANFPKAGGYGACGGGDGGAGSPSTSLRDEVGGTGNGPLQRPLGGGTGGRLACAAGCGRGSGGGGGSLATQGDPNYRTKTIAANPPATSQPTFVQQTGSGGQGCTGNAGTASRQLSGGSPGAAVFIDSRDDNNFWGSAINFRLGLRIAGELSVPIGGGGGGGGGDLSYNTSCTTSDVNFANDSSGGGGGGGGGVLIVKALGDIIVRESGRITADGGSGGGGEQANTGWKGGGGGAGAGGMVVLMSATRIEINTHGGNSTVAPFGRIDTYAQKDYDFAISADGGVCTTGTTLAPIVVGKYPANRGQETITAATYDSMPLGALGGMGIVQLMAPPGTNADGTNTVLDDNIRVLRQGIELSGALKQQMLAWRGFPNAQGTLVDDNGTPTNIGDNEGDIRPAPMLMPVPFSATSRIRSKWLDTGASDRIRQNFDNGDTRTIVDPTGTPGSLYGPIYQFAGIDSTTGYASYASAGGESVKINYPLVVPATSILSSDTNATFLDKPSYRVQLSTAALGGTVDLYSQYEAEVLDAVGSVVGSFRILSHTDRVLQLSPESGAFPATARDVQVRAKFFQVITSGQEGLGSTYPGSVGGQRVPNSNVRIGFAFHQDPANSAATRYPAAAGTYVYNLEDPLVQEAVRQLGASYVQFDILFDCNFRSTPGDTPPALGPSSPRPELHFLRLPFRF
jgi:hypothetical protein